jgi:hypothetical protein
MGFRFHQGRVELDLRWRPWRRVRCPCETAGAVPAPPWACPTAAGCGRASSMPSSNRCWECFARICWQPAPQGSSCGITHGLVSRLLVDGSLSARPAGLLALIETPEALKGYLLRAQGQDDAKRRAQRCITAVQEAARLAAGRGLALLTGPRQVSAGPVPRIRTHPPERLGRPRREPERRRSPAGERLKNS